jgi:Na+/proline symporter
LNLYLIFLSVYAVVLIAAGLLISRRVKKAADFFVAGRTLGPGLLATTFLAANIGAGSTVGASGLGYRYGLSAWWWVGSAAIGSFILATTVGPKIWALAEKYQLHTVGDYLDRRYHRGVRGTIAVLLWLGTLAILVSSGRSGGDYVFRRRRLAHCRLRELDSTGGAAGRAAAGYSLCPRHPGRVAGGGRADFLPLQ